MSTLHDLHENGATARELVDDVAHAELAPVMGTILDEVLTPDVIGILRPFVHYALVWRLPQRHRSPIQKDQPAALWARHTEK